MFEIFKDKRVQIGLVILTIIFMIIGSFRINKGNKYELTLSDELLTSLGNSKLLSIDKKKSSKKLISYDKVKFVLPSENFEQDKDNEQVYYYKKGFKSVAALRIDKTFNVYTMLIEGDYKQLDAIEYDYKKLFESYSINSFTDLFKYIRKNYKTEIKDDMSEDEKMMIYLGNSLSVYDLKSNIYIIDGNVEGFMTFNDDIFDIYLEKEDELYNFTFINTEYKFATLESVQSFLENVVF